MGSRSLKGQVFEGTDGDGPNGSLASSEKKNSFISLNSSFRLISVYPGMGPKGPSVVIAIQSVGDRGEISF
jgi:hypothetical protein